MARSQEHKHGEQEEEQQQLGRQHGEQGDGTQRF